MTPSSLSEAEVAALREALDDEFKAIATYERVIEDFGAIHPFVNIVEAERRHAQALVGLCARYGIPVPDNTWTGRAPTFDSVEDACRAGVAGEIDNAAMYDRLLAVTDRPDILAVFENLRSASQDNHLPAFERCRQRGGRGQGRGGGSRRHRRMC